MKRYKAKVSASVELIVWVNESENDEIELDEIDEVLDVEEFDNVRELG